MATPTTPASTSAAPATQGTIVFVQGEAYLRDRQGKLQAIKPGDAVAEGQEIVTTAGAVVDVQLPSGAKLSIGPDRQVLLNDELFATSAPEPTENVVSSLGADADKVIQALNTGGDPFAGLEDPAAGLNGGGNSDQTHDFVRLVRILEDVTPRAFNYTSSSDGIDFLPVSSIPAQPTVTATNQPPVATDDPAFTTREDEATTVTVLTNDSDPDGDPISVTRATAPNGTVTLNPDGTLRYVPNPDFNGTDTITYTISDGKGGTATATVTVNVTPVNDPPVARPDTASTNEDTPVILPVLGNDSDADGDPLTVTNATVNPAQGSVVINPDGTLSFTPAPNFNGPAQITYTIDDGKGGTTTAVVTVNVAPVNDAPVARDDVDGLVKTDTVPATGNLITNPAGLDTDLDGDALTVSAIGATPVAGATVVNGLFGTLTIQPNGEYSYVQDVTNPAIVGLAPTGTLQDRFTYTVSDGKGGTATATLTLNIAGANTPPVAQPDTVSTNEDTPLTFPVLGNDSDPEGDPLTVTGATVDPAQGSVVVNPDGTLSFTPAPNFNGPAQISYTIDDGKGGTTAAVVTVNVAPQNDAPVANDTATRGAEDAASIPVTLSGTDPDGTVASFTLGTLPTNGTLYLDAAHTQPIVPGTPIPAGAGGTTTLYFVPSPNWNGTTDFPYTATDNLGLASPSATATIEVTPQNDAPIANDAVARGAEDAASIPVTLSGTDPDGTVASFTLGALPTNGTLYLDAAHTQPVTPGAPIPAGTAGSTTLYFVPAPNWNGTTDFPYTATDNDNLVSAPAQARITVDSVNDAPVANDTTARGAEDAASIPVTLSGADPDGTVASFTLGTLPTNGTLFLDAAHTQPVVPGTPIPAGTGGTTTLYFVPSPNWNGTTDFPYTATDNDNLVSPPAQARITVDSVIDDPIANNTAARGAEDATSIPVTLSGSDVDGTVASFTLGALPTNGTLYLDAAHTQPVTAGTPIPAGTGGTTTLHFVPAPNWNGETRFPYTATDNDNLASAPAEARITVDSVNDAPIANDTAARGAEDATSIPVTLSGTDPDGSVASFTLGTLPTNGTLYLDAAHTQPVTAGTPIPAGTGGTTTLHFVPAPNWNGETRFPYTVTDNDNLASAPAEASITVDSANDAPVANDTAARGAEDAASIPVTLSGSDVDGTVASFTLGALPTNGTLFLDAAHTQPVTPGTPIPAGAGGTTTLYFVPAPNWNGETRFPYTATDNDNLASAPAEARITVDSVNDAPVANDTAARGAEDATSIPVTLSGTDPDGTVASFTLGALPTNGTLYLDAAHTQPVVPGTPIPAGASGTTTLYFVPAPNWNGETRFPYTATDNDNLASAPAEASITVDSANDAPVANDTAARGAEDAASIPITLSGSDVDGTVASFTLGALPTNGTLYLDAAHSQPVVPGTPIPAGTGGTTTLHFVPAPNWNGETRFPYTVTDNDNLASAPAEARITVDSVNDAPVANDTTARGAEDAASIPVTLSGSDVDGTVASFTLGALPTNGTLYLDAAHTQPVVPGTPIPAGAGGTTTLYFVPAPNWNGETRFPYTVTDNDNLASAPAEARITVDSVNDAPVANDTAARGAEDATSIPVTLNGSDVDGTVASFTLGALPTNGTLYLDAAHTQPVTAGTPIPAGTGGTTTLHFVPSPNWNGTTDFPYTATDNLGLASPSAVATIEVTPQNDAPIANDTAARGAEDAASIPVILSGSDVDGTVASFTLGALPTNGTLFLDAAHSQPVVPGTPIPAGTGGTTTLHFVPAPNWNGETRFPYTVTDNDNLASAPAEARITVDSVNDTPVANDTATRGAEDAASIPVTLSGSDMDGTVASFTLGALPTNGTLFLDAAHTQPVTPGTPIPAGAGGTTTLYFVPAPNWNGTTDFPYTVTDNDNLASPPAEARITVDSVNDAPVANDTAARGAEDATSIPVTLSGTDPDGSVASFTLGALPTNGTLFLDAAHTQPVTAGTPIPAGTGGTTTLHFVPAPNWNGETRFPYTATDNDNLASPPATATIEVTPQNDAPIANDDRGAVPEGSTLTVLANNGLIASSLAPLGKDSDAEGDRLTIIAIRTGEKTGTGTPGNVDTPLVGTHGQLTVHDDGSYTYTATDDSLAAGATTTDTFTYTISDGQGGTDTAELVITITGTNDAPVVRAATANVSEEGLPGGEADTLGTTDTTNAASHSGVISLSDVDGDTLSVTLSAPADLLSSAGVPITWAGSGTQTLIGSAGGVEIMRATVSNDGRYTVTLSGAIDHPATTGEDARSLDFGVSVSDGIDTIQSTLTITVEDDAPQAAQINQTIEVAPIDTNLLLILDTSSSMNTRDGVGGTSRLATAISALNQLLDSYDNFGEVRVRLVAFSDVSSSRGSGWMAVSEAKALLAALTPRGGTNYDEALATAQSAFTTPGKLASGQNIAYFLSDGQPSFTQWAVDANEESAWKSFLSTNGITSYALGMGSATVQSDLNPIAYNGITNTDLDGQVITDFNKLAGALQTTIPPTASGEILSGSLHGTGFGGDGGHVSSITVDGVTYTPDTSLGTLTASGGASTATYDAATNSIRVLTATSGTLALDFDTGSYTYTPPPSVSTSVINDGFTYVLTDNDGDSASSGVDFTASRMNENAITLSSPQQVSGTSGNDSITGSSGNDSISGGAGNDIIKGGDGVDLIAGGAGHDTLTGGAGADTFKWSLGDAGTAAAPAVDAITDFNTAAASSGGDVLDLRDLLQGESHTGNLAGNLGSYLHFEKIGADTVVNVSSSGGFSSGNYSAADQKLILQGVDLTTLGGDTQIIQNLLANGKLNTD